MLVSTWQAGAVPQMTFGHDIFALLEGAWKWKWGILPDRDYYSHMGALVYFLIYLGMKLGGGLLQAIPAASCLLAACLLPGCIYLTFTRLAPPAAFAATFVLIALVLAPYPLRYDAGDLGYTCIYNRWGYGILLLSLFTVLLQPGNTNSGMEITDGAILGVLLTVAIFFKISYGLLILVVPFAYAFVLRRTYQYYVAALLSAVLIGLLILPLIGWDFSAFLRDMTIAAHARKGLDLEGIGKACSYIHSDVCCLLVLSLVCCAAEVLQGASLLSVRLTRILALTATYIVYSAAVTLTNSPSGNIRETPALSVAAIILLDRLIKVAGESEMVDREQRLKFLRRHKWQFSGSILLLLVLLGGDILYFSIAAGEYTRTALGIMIFLMAPLFVMPNAEEELLKIPGRFFVLTGCVLAAALIVPNLSRNICGLRDACQDRKNGTALPPDQVFHTGTLAGLQILAFGGDPPLPTSYVGKVEDGLRLLERSGNGDKPVEDMDFSNPFNVVRGVKPPVGSPVAWQLDMVFSADSAPDARQVFIGAPVVMAPKLFGDGRQRNLAIMSRLYAKYLEAHYRLAAVSDQWWLYVQK